MDAKLLMGCKSAELFQISSVIELVGIISLVPWE